MMREQDITYFARTNHRGTGVPFGIRRRDRRSHMYVLGKTGTGKSHLLRTMILQDIANGEGCALFDPHGDLAREVMTAIPIHRRADVVYLEAPDPTCRWRFNPFHGVERNNTSLAAAGLVEVFKKLWPDEWGPRLEHLLRNVAFTLLDTPGATFADVPALLTDRAFRSRVTASLGNSVVREFWQNEFERYSPAFRAVVIAPLQNKVGALLTDSTLNRILCSEGPRLDVAEIMNNGKILLVNLDKGRIGEGPSALLGSLLVSHIALSGLARSAQLQTTRRDFWVFLDEFQNITTLALATMMSELRKYGVGLTLAHQHLAQLDSSIRDAVFGNIGTLVSFRVGAADAAYLARELAPRFSAADVIGLPRYDIYVRLLIGGEANAPFSASTLAEWPGSVRPAQH